MQQFCSLQECFCAQLSFQLCWQGHWYSIALLYIYWQGGEGGVSVRVGCPLESTNEVSQSITGDSSLYTHAHTRTMLTRRPAHFAITDELRQLHVTAKSDCATDDRWSSVAYYEATHHSAP